MAYANIEHGASNLRQLISAPFVALNNLMDSLANANAMAHDAEQLVDMSDAQLAAKGLTRAEAIEAVFAKRADN
ncbi:hypothetical protein [Planktotalea sp.]|uniref:hypothetical protein n=1 Tax=Planktotalea sp. TaxID=2029877 RepID=UPI003297083F